MRPVRVSVLVASRSRPENLERSLQSLTRTCAVPGSVEFLIALDEDDSGSTAAIDGIRERSETEHRVFVVERSGYERLHEYYNHLMRHARGEWMVFWSDDAIQTRFGWDLAITRWTNRALVIFPGSDDDVRTYFPILWREYAVAVGHFAQWQGVDTYLWRVMGPTGALAFIRGMRISHTRIDDGLVGNHQRHVVPCPPDAVLADRRIARTVIQTRLSLAMRIRARIVAMLIGNLYYRTFPKRIRQRLGLYARGLEPVKVDLWFGR